MKELTTKQLHSKILKNNLYIEDGFAKASIIKEYASRVIESEIIIQNGKIVGWAIVWKVMVYEGIFTKKLITLIGCFVLEEHRRQGLGEQALINVLKKYKKRPGFNKKEEISYCDEWSKFGPILKKLKFNSRIIHSVCAASIKTCPDFNEKEF